MTIHTKNYAELAALVREAAAILDGTKPMRFPIVDELEGFAGMLEEDAGKTPPVPEGEQKHPDTVRIDTLDELMGYVQNGSDTTVKLFQDDATRDYLVVVGENPMKPTTYHGRSLRSAIDDAAKNMQPQKD